MPEEIKNTFEQHLQTVLTMLGVMAVAWAGAQLFSYESRLVRVEEQLIQLNAKLDQLTEMRGAVDDLRTRVLLLERDNERNKVKHVGN